VLKSDSLSSPLVIAYSDPHFRLAWDNDVKLHVSRHLLHLRRYREMSQAKLARRVGTSQPAIARIEAGEENITEQTLERIVTALDGRFRVSISPQELQMPEWPMPWWEAIGAGLTSAKTWTMRLSSTHVHHDAAEHPTKICRALWTAEAEQTADAELKQLTSPERLIPELV
jgi:transcriptional regulator with XRE-family HTH domain